MKNYVIVKSKVLDTFSLPGINPGDTLLEMAVDVAGYPQIIRTTGFWNQIDQNQLEVKQIAVELYRLAAAIYSADTRIVRKEAFDNWSRDIALHFPVSDLNLWQEAKDTLEKLLNFLTGDHWEINFRQDTIPRPSINKNKWKHGAKLETKKVSLFSGGLDSFIGASDLLSKKESVILVGHHSDNTTINYQKLAFGALKKNYPDQKSVFISLFVRPPSGIGEPTTRSRSFLFYSLASLVASSLGEEASLIIPENGFIGLNIPLTLTRLGSLSTRTTHPHTVFLFSELLRNLNMPIPLAVPYKFMTKGEMLVNANDPNFLKENLNMTMSCAHPATGRFSKGNPNFHCGYCVPCIIRRAAVNKAGFSETNYNYNLLSRGIPRTRGKAKDPKAFLLSIERASLHSMHGNALRSGPLHGNDDDVRNYIKVYKNGLQEVSEFLSTLPSL